MHKTIVNTTVRTDCCEGIIMERCVGSCTSPLLAEEVVVVARFCCMPWRSPGMSAGLVRLGISAGLVRPEAAAACCRTAWEGTGVIISSCSVQY